jgi:hypothetical protein
MSLTVAAPPLLLRQNLHPPGRSGKESTTGWADGPYLYKSEPTKDSDLAFRFFRPNGERSQRDNPWHSGSGRPAWERYGQESDSA